MKTLLVLRHGKAQPDAPRGDWSRDLTERGRRAAKTMGELIQERIGRPDAIVSSDAHRAKQTAEIAAEAIGFDGQVVLEHAIYEAWLPDLIDVVRSLPEGAGTVVIVGHNPGFEALVVALAGLDPTAVRLPTAGLAHLELDVARWAEVGPNSGRLVALYTPKEVGG
jgi:phosphohistidine phosphatase